jgi:hypothetical protein
MWMKSNVVVSMIIIQVARLIALDELIHQYLFMKTSVEESWNIVMTIDYRFASGRFPVTASCVTISNPDSRSSSETGVNPGIKSQKCTYLNELDDRKPSAESISQRSEQLRLHNLV